VIPLFVNGLWAFVLVILITGLEPLGALRRREREFESRRGAPTEAA
jgi:hypothetical protein